MTYFPKPFLIQLDCLLPSGTLCMLGHDNHPIFLVLYCAEERSRKATSRKQKFKDLHVSTVREAREIIDLLGPISKEELSCWKRTYLKSRTCLQSKSEDEMIVMLVILLKLILLSTTQIVPRYYSGSCFAGF